MGQKVNPISFRVGVRGCNKKWGSRWFSKNQYADIFLEDIRIRDYLNKNYAHTKIDKIDIERSGDHVKIVVYSASPGILIGKKGADIENLRGEVSKLIAKKSIELVVSEVRDPLLSATIVSRSVADQLERRVTFKRAIKKAAADVMRAGAKGVKIRVSGRLDGAEIARDEWIRVGSTPLHTLRADIDYALSEAKTIYGQIGVKVWICRGEYRSSVAL